MSNGERKLVKEEHHTDAKRAGDVIRLILKDKNE